MSTTLTDVTLDALQPGDILLSLGAFGVIPARNNHFTVVTATPVLGETMAQVRTSHTDYMVPSDTLVSVQRINVTPTLLISRRPALHATILSLGVPVTRRTPLTDDETAPAVTSEEWEAAESILIDGYLAYASIRGMWEREEFTPEGKFIVAVGDDVDHQRMLLRAQGAHAQALVMLPDAAPQLLQHLHAVLEERPLDLL